MPPVDAVRVRLLALAAVGLAELLAVRGVKPEDVARVADDAADPVDGVTVDGGDAHFGVAVAVVLGRCSVLFEGGMSSAVELVPGEGPFARQPEAALVLHGVFVR